MNIDNLIKKTITYIPKETNPNLTIHYALKTAIEGQQDSVGNPEYTIEPQTLTASVTYSGMRENKDTPGAKIISIPFKGRLINPSSFPVWFTFSMVGHGEANLSDKILTGDVILNPAVSSTRSNAIADHLGTAIEGHLLIEWV